MVDYFAEGVAAADEIGRGKLALEDGILEMVTEIAHGLVDGAQALVVADVVTDEIGIAHDRLSQSREEAQTVETSAAKAYRAENFDGLAALITPSKPDMVARESI
jgi:hypothetical protein